VKILFPLAGTAGGVGSEDYMYDVARRLSARGHEITLLLPHGRPLPDARFKAEYYRPSPAPKPLLWRVWYPFAVAQQILAVATMKLPARYDAIVTGLLPALFGLSLRMKATPRIYLVLSPLAWFELLSYGKPTLGLRIGAAVYHWLQRWAWRHCEAVVSFTPTMTGFRTRFLKGSPRKLIESAPGVDFARFTPGERNVSLLAEFGIPADAPLVISFCRLIESKDIAFLLRAFARPEVPSQAHLLVVGKGPSLDGLRAHAEDLRLAGRVHFAGFRDNVEDYLRLGQVYAFPSRLESFGLTLAQAMASGLPAVARRDSFPNIITSSASMIEDGTSGLLVDDEREMAGAIATLLTDRQLRERMAAAAVRSAREHFCWDRHLDAIDAALVELAGR
jgi:glycosyltransferase involved in cell wall biosynthesis